MEGELAPTALGGWYGALCCISLRGQVVMCDAPISHPLYQHPALLAGCAVCLQAGFVPSVCCPLAHACANAWLQDAERYFNELAEQAEHDQDMQPNTVTYAALISGLGGA